MYKAKLLTEIATKMRIYEGRHLQTGATRFPELLAVVFLMSLPYIAENFESLQKKQDKLTSKLKPEYLLNVTEEFDYIIVGGGSAGSVVANRLSRPRRNRVLLLEIGGDPNPLEDLPSFYGALANQNQIYHRYLTEARDDVCLQKQGICTIVTGRGLGGASGVNNMMYSRGSASDFNEWARITGDPTWAYHNVLKAFKKSEDYHGYFAGTVGNSHRTGGELYISKEASSPVLRDTFFLAAKELGMNLHDFNSEFVKGAGRNRSNKCMARCALFNFLGGRVHGTWFSATGYGPFDAMIKHGVRWGSYKAFLKPILQRKNLNIYRYAKAIKIHLDDFRKVEGVEYIRHGIRRYVRAKKEVIVSANAIESAKLLLLSGIGPKEHLTSVGVKPLVDLPVGKYFQDHVNTDTLIFSVNRGLMFNPSRDLRFSDIMEYLAQGTGPLAARDFNPGSSVIYTSSSEQGNDAYPDLEIFIQAKTPFPPANAPKDQFTLLSGLLRPKSFGTIQLLSSNHEDEPRIDSKFFAVKSDRRRLMEGLLFAVNVVENTKAFQLMNGTFELDQGIPECNSLGFKTELYWKCLLRRRVISGLHTYGSCRMGRIGDPKAVVDSKLRVLNTTGLRIIDNSVIPGVISAHPCAPAIMIGEMGSSFILQKKDKQ